VGQPELDSRTLVRDAEQVRTVDDFKAWTRAQVRPVLPHGALACGHGHLHAGGFTLDYVLPVDFPLEHIAAIRNRAGGIDSPIIRRWVQTREPVVFNEETPWPGISESWLEQFKRHDLLNGVAHGVYDQEQCIASYFSFHRLPNPPDAVEQAILSTIIPLMHETLANVITRLRQTETREAALLATLAPREREVSHWVGLGKTNSEIAQLLGLSENTVKHHITASLKKTGLQNRAQLTLLFAEHDRHASRRSSTKVL
jgi:DNA-binding CsgD family transcriptional regulator